MAVAVNSETGYERQNLPEPTDCLWILQPSHVTRSHKNANVKRYAVATLPRTDGVIAHKWHTTRTGKPGRSAQTYFSFPSPAPLPNAHAHEEKLRLACESKVHVSLASQPYSSQCTGRLYTQMLAEQLSYSASARTSAI